MKVLLVDDDSIILSVAKTALRDTSADIVTHTDPTEALQEDLTSFDVIVSDFHMPTMRGDAFLKNVRASAPNVPFVFLTINDSIGIAVELIRHGADDYIQKPIEPADFSYRIQKAIRDKKREIRIAEIEQERCLIDLEKRKLINWRMLYASKDARQTEKLIENLSRNINQSGGFLWLDMLTASMTELDESAYSVPREILDMSITAAENSRRLLELTEFIGRVDSIELSPETLDAEAFFRRIRAMIEESLVPIAESHGRTVAVYEPPSIDGVVTVEIGRIGEILRELIANAIKYSPPRSPIRLDFDVMRHQQRSGISIRIANVARELQAKNDEGRPIVGIPYDYQELVFDLFFTIDAFPQYIDEENWTDGAGLYIARKLAQRMGGWITVHSGMDYTIDPAEPVVRMDLYIPVEHNRES